MKRTMWKRDLLPPGKPPALLLTNPKYAHNVAAAIRAASCFGISQVWFTGDRVKDEVEETGRLPREERMRGYRDVDVCHTERPYDAFADVQSSTVPVAVEFGHGYEPLPIFEHPENALYVFGPEDGGLRRIDNLQCHRFLTIPTLHCVNLAAAIYLVLYDRLLKSPTWASSSGPDMPKEVS